MDPTSFPSRDRWKQLLLLGLDMSKVHECIVKYASNRTLGGQQINANTISVVLYIYKLHEGRLGQGHDADCVENVRVKLFGNKDAQPVNYDAGVASFHRVGMEVKELTRAVMKTYTGRAAVVTKGHRDEVAARFAQVADTKRAALALTHAQVQANWSNVPSWSLALSDDEFIEQMKVSQALVGLNETPIPLRKPKVFARAEGRNVVVATAVALATQAQHRAQVAQAQSVGLRRPRPCDLARAGAAVPPAPAAVPPAPAPPNGQHVIPHVIVEPVDRVLVEGQPLPGAILPSAAAWFS